MYLVSKDFLETSHGQLGCINCHSGENLPTQEQAHATMNPYPSEDNDGVCAQCHVGVTETYASSIHYNLHGMENGLMSFASTDSMPDSPAHAEVFDKNCMSCHATCGECHVSRPSNYTGGLINQHEFFKTPPMEETCYGCHGARTAGEFMGEVGFSGDVHFELGMDCMDCHNIDNFHGTGEVGERMWDEALPSCLDCHEEEMSGNSQIEAHNAHGDMLSCQVCHAQANNNCFECHVTYNEDKSALKSASDSKLMFRIGLNPNPTEERPYKYVTLRHIPTAANSFDTVEPNMLPNFDNINNWKYSPTHNIQRSTFQNESCESCHDNDKLFLREEDIIESDSKENLRLIVPRP
ncbi:MAG: hypothetical protein M0Q14_05100 [Tissierellaceae bacterium]|nr:hypothetical protein [Tissierellaceae bacterium]